MTENIDEKKTLSPHELMLAAFETERIKHSGKIQQVSEAFRTSSNLTAAAHLLYEVRQDLVDYKREISKTLGELQRDVKRQKKERMMSHKGGELAILPANVAEKKILDDAYFAGVVHVIDKFDTQFEWCKDSIETCDQQANGYSYHIKLAQLLGNNAIR